MNKNKIIIILITFSSCFFIIAIAHFQYFETRSKILELYGEKQVILAKQIALSLKQYFNDRIWDLEVLSNQYSKGSPNWLKLSENLNYVFGRNIYENQILFVNSRNEIEYNLARSKAHSDGSNLTPIIRQQILSFHQKNKSEKLDTPTNLPLHTPDPNQYQLEWYRLWYDTGSQGGKGVAIDSYGHIYQTGYTTSGPFGLNDGKLIKLDSSGAPIWNRTWGTTQNDGGYGVALDSNEYVYVVGTADYGTAENLEKFILLKYDSSGNYQWNRTWSDMVRANGRSIP